MLFEHSQTIFFFCDFTNLLSLVGRNEKHFFQHLNKASPDYGAHVVIRTPKNPKIQNSHWKRVQNAFLNCRNPFKMPKKIFKVCLVGTLNLCLKEPEKMQKTRNQSDHPIQRKRPKTGKILPNSNFAIFWQFFLVFSAQSLEYPQRIL